MEQAYIERLVIEDLDGEETDDEVWAWALEHIVLASGLPITPWTRHTLVRDEDGRRATITLHIPVPVQDPRRC
jgi:hypothetical protein